MFARIFSFQFDYDPAMDAPMEQLGQQNMKELREQQGFVKLYQLLDRQAGKGVQIHFWETEGDLQRYLASPVAQAMQARSQAIAKDFSLANPNKAEHFEVVQES